LFFKLTRPLLPALGFPGGGGLADLLPDGLGGGASVRE